MPVDDNTDKSSIRPSEVAAAVVFAPALVRVMDALRPNPHHLACEGLELEDIEIESLDGTLLHMTACGKGTDTLFFVHGWTCNESIFRFQQEQFSDRYRIYTLELRGHGKSAVPESLDYHPDRLAEDLQAAVRHVNPSSFVVAGHSLGGFTAFKWFEHFGSDYGGRLKGLEIIDSTGTDLVDGIIFGSAIRHVYPAPLGLLLAGLGRHNRISQAVKTAIRDTSLAYFIVRWGAFGRKPKREHVEHVREMVLNTHMTSLSLAAKACLDYHYDYYLPKVDVPVSLLVGDKDKLTNREANELTASLLPDARVRVFEGAGHCAMLERRDEFNEEMDAFLAEVFEL
jgi:pimeloyl-ACP methyl ester carboxylesterase